MGGPFRSDISRQDQDKTCLLHVPTYTVTMAPPRGFSKDQWRAVDHEGEVLESNVTKSGEKQAVLTFLKKVMKRYGAPKVIGNVEVAAGPPD